MTCLTCFCVKFPGTIITKLGLVSVQLYISNTVKIDNNIAFLPVNPTDSGILKSAVID